MVHICNDELVIELNNKYFILFKILDGLVNVIFVDICLLNLARSMESTYVCLGEHPLHSGS